jgi:hypothetical protein
MEPPEWFTSPSDTHPKMARLQIELLRQLPPWRKFQMAGNMYSLMKNLALVGLRERHPTATDEEIRRKLADLLLGPELAAWLYVQVAKEKKDAE